MPPAIIITGPGSRDRQALGFARAMADANKVRRKAYPGRIPGSRPANGSASMMPRRVLVLDFDGVLCDSWRECAFVTWAGQHGWAPAEFGVSAFQAIPAAFIKRFHALRGYARHLGHFLVPVLASSEQIRCQHDFDRYYAGLAPTVVAEFVKRVSEFRVRVRTGQRAQWLAFQELYEGVHGLLSRLENRLYIVTTGDRESVRELLAAHGIAVDSERIYDEQHSKGAALFDIQAREHAAVYLVDDNLDDVMTAQADGHHAAWAQWGYSAPEHHPKAALVAVPVLSLPELSTAALAVTDAPSRPAHKSSVH
jgi:phosphoglycolate phosphatase-like HAD superfamily hydrolase